ncbi:hypothetical protein OPIT5_17660 [Opitutaceae bacterium TAV5]|nr:hypothetical protein OPIT5_17660 [Opitutaceae bacterium TAV5]
MKFNAPTAFRPFRTALVVLAGLALAGAAVRPLEDPAWQEIRAQQPGFQFKSLEGALGQGITVGLLGGFQAIVADFFWLKTNSVWENNDLPATQTYIKLVTAIDPRPIYFWQNGSRMIAYDMPNWRIDDAGGWDKVPDAVKRKFDEEQSSVGVSFLETGLGFHPREPLLYIEIANIYLNRLKDPATASTWYLKATEQPDAPQYAYRIYAELLRRVGRKQEAYDWLKKLYPTLPKEGDAAMYAMPNVVLERIRELEGELNIPAAQRFDPGPGVVEPPPAPPAEGS